MADPMEQIIAHGFDLAKQGKKEEAYKVLKAVSENLPESHPANREALGAIRTRLVALCNDTGRQSEAADYAEWVLKNAPPDEEAIRMMLQVALQMAGRDPMIGQAKKVGCFIATASYGSPFAAEVVTLSRFRDEVLLKSKMGTVFVKFYYAVSPPLAGFISRRGILRAATRQLLLKPILRVLKAASKFQ